MRVIANMSRHNICQPTDAPIHSANYLLIARRNNTSNNRFIYCTSIAQCCALLTQKGIIITFVSAICAIYSKHFAQICEHDCRRRIYMEIPTLHHSIA